MLIRCVKLISATTGEELTSSPWMVKQKVYVVLALRITLREGVMAIFQSDHYGDPTISKLEGFEIISQKIPKCWDVKISNRFYYLMPKSWMYESFLDDLENEEPMAMNLYRKEAEIMYRDEGMEFKP